MIDWFRYITSKNSSLPSRPNVVLSRIKEYYYLLFVYLYTNYLCGKSLGRKKKEKKRSSCHRESFGGIAELAKYLWLWQLIIFRCNINLIRFSIGPDQRAQCLLPAIRPYHLLGTRFGRQTQRGGDHTMRVKPPYHAITIVHS